MTLKMIRSGGQSGSDQAAWRAAKAAGLGTAGWMVRGFWTETGQHPEFAELYGAAELELPLSSMAALLRRRALANVRDADATLCFDEAGSKATDNAYEDCHKLGRPFRCVMLERAPDGRLGRAAAAHTPENIAEWLAENRVRALNVCGNRESKAPGIGALVEAFLARVFALTNPKAEEGP
jgi:hypothetical protein